MVVCDKNKGRNCSQRIRDLAIFNFKLVAPNTEGICEYSSMTISFCKDWIAKDIIDHILRKAIDNPIFGHSFFANIIKYIKKYEMDDNHNHDCECDVGDIGDF
eukprot:TRINITY_DN7463_c0_g1_i1.p1 TRINITY_DN7463_c0_g1~~TRINITY_DN7463_c0_g1_i1.p1  ORF type:complete len:103 (+),score=30.77 TRINITY_DN7463_c0_g1_i1:57-365(+)